MRIFKTKWFHRWTRKEGLDDDSLRTAVEEVQLGLIDADLGGHVFKKRVALPGRGKSGSLRTMLVFKRNHDVFFVYGFAKKARATVSASELRALRRLAKELLSYSEMQIDKALKAKKLMEIRTNGK